MESMVIRDNLVCILVRLYQVDPGVIGPETRILHPEGLGLSSLQVLNLVLAVEQEFGCEFSEEDLSSELYNHTLESLTALIDRYLAGTR